MIYISILLVIAGIILLVYSIFSASDATGSSPPFLGKATAAPSVKKDAGGKGPDAADPEVIIPVNEVKKVYDESHDRSTIIQPGDNDISSQGKDVDARDGDGNRHGHSFNEVSGVVFFEDSSSVIDYDRSSGSIDPSLEEYGKIRRIGEGRLTVEGEGLNFYIGRKFYRYDFHIIREIKTGENFMAVFISGSDSVKLFLMGSREFINAADIKFREYVRGSR